MSEEACKKRVEEEQRKKDGWERDEEVCERRLSESEKSTRKSEKSTRKSAKSRSEYIPRKNTSAFRRSRQHARCMKRKRQRSEPGKPRRKLPLQRPKAQE